MTFSIEDWQAQFAEAAAHLENKGGSKKVGFQCKLETVYPIKIKTAKVVESPFKMVQLELDIGVQSDAGEDASEIGTVREWVTIPYQQRDFELPPDRVARQHNGRKKDVTTLLSASDPSAFALYARKVPKVTKGFDFYDFEDKLMSSADFDARKKSIDAALEEAVKKMHAGVGQPVDELQGAELYLVKVPGSKGDGKSFAQFHLNEPAGYPLHGATQEKVPF